MMLTYKKMKIMVLSTSLLSLGAFATPLEKIHFNDRWMIHRGSIVNTVYNFDHQKMETVTCDAIMHSAYTKAGELHDSDYAYFMMKTLNNCKTEKFKDPSYFDFVRIRYVPNTIWASFSVDLEQVASSANGSYEDNWLAQDVYTTNDHQVVYDNRVLDGTRVGLYEVSVKDKTISFNYNEYNSDKSIIRVVSGTFSTDAAEDPSDE